MKNSAFDGPGLQYRSEHATSYLKNSKKAGNVNATYYLLFSFIVELEHEVHALRDEVLRLKGMTSSLDRERDLLQQEVDQKTEQLADAEATKARQVEVFNILTLTRLTHKEFESFRTRQRKRFISRDLIGCFSFYLQGNLCSFYRRKYGRCVIYH